MRATPAPTAPSESTATLARRLISEREERGAEIPRLVIQGGACHGQELRLETQGQPYRIGRSAACHLVVADDDMSREHAEIERRWDAVFMRDLGSKNGVLLGGERLSRERRLADGDVVVMGQTRFMLDDPRDRHLRQVQDGAAPTAAASPALADTHTAVRANRAAEAGGEQPLARPPGTGRARPMTMMVIAAVVLMGTIGLALSFLLAR
jgi:hypothetical protein